MQRLAATITLDLQLQWKNGFYYAVGFVLLCWLVVLTQLPEIDWGYVLPAIVFGNLVMVNFYFMAGLVLLEKGEGTLEAQVVTPLADWEYLVSKTVTLAALSLVEQFVIVGSAYGLGFGVGALIAGVAVPHPVPWTHICAMPPGVAHTPRAPRSACDTQASRDARSGCTAPRSRPRRRGRPRGSERFGRGSLAP